MTWKQKTKTEYGQSSTFRRGVVQALVNADNSPSRFQLFHLSFYHITKRPDQSWSGNKELALEKATPPYTRL